MHVFLCKAHIHAGNLDFRSEKDQKYSPFECKTKYIVLKPIEERSLVQITSF